MFTLVGMIQFHGCARPVIRPSPTSRIGIAGYAGEGPAVVPIGQTAGPSTDPQRQRIIPRYERSCSREAIGCSPFDVWGSHAGWPGTERSISGGSAVVASPP